ncbi:hypothetical protein SHJG_8677 [Streptomyces hygroscopicus subsp. jinggangensis 5008]|nr:hypothetical protein SHJG_8677 [Streptomyces hygroscopicus subsp. jinggangensis 5008]AGF68098.1 hypothetical protein SHJGH_8436 [Streptomyces hygroscopicus subsp. jinggangensis TL01]
MFRLGALYPGHVVEEKVVTVTGAEPAQFGSRAVREHPAQDAGLVVDARVAQGLQGRWSGGLRGWAAGGCALSRAMVVEEGGRTPHDRSWDEGGVTGAGRRKHVECRRRITPVVEAVPCPVNVGKTMCRRQRPNP